MIHSIYSFSEAPERESSWSTADTTLKIVKNIQFRNNFILIYLFFFLCESAHCFCSFSYLKVFPCIPPPQVMRKGMVVYPHSVARVAKKDTRSCLLVGTPHSQNCRRMKREPENRSCTRCSSSTVACYNTQIILQEVTTAL